MTTRQPFFSIVYNGKDVTNDISRYLVQMTYTDNVTGQADELELILDDAQFLWANEWLPEKGDTIDVNFGYVGATVPAGRFEVDEVEFSGMPAQINIRGLSTGFKTAARTLKSYAHEGKTLAQIADVVANANGLTVTGEILPVTIDRVTQHRETDLGFLRRLAEQYGHCFAVRGNTLVFSSVYQLEAEKSVTALAMSDLLSWSVRDKVSETFGAAKSEYHNPKTRKVVRQTFGAETTPNLDGVTFSEVRANDTMIVHTKAENVNQAETQARAALHKANSRQQTARFSLEGNPLLVSGNNVDCTELGKFSGKFHIETARHTITRDGGYLTEIDAKRIGLVEIVKQKPKKKPVKGTVKIVTE